MDAKSPVDEVLCSKSTCDTTLITCSVRHYDEFQYDHGENGMRTGADQGRDGEDMCDNLCFLGKFATLISGNAAHKKQTLIE